MDLDGHLHFLSIYVRGEGSASIPLGPVEPLAESLGRIPRSLGESDHVRPVVPQLALHLLVNESFGGRIGYGKLIALHGLAPGD